MKKQEVIPVSIVDITKEEIQKKEQPAPKKVTKKQEEIKKKEVTKKEDNTKQVIKEDNKKDIVQKDNNKKIEQNKETKKADETQAKLDKVEEKPFRPKGADDPLVMPDINVPLTENIDIPEIKMPDIPKLEQAKEMAENQKNFDVSKELAALQNTAPHKNDNNSHSSDVATEVKRATDNNIKDNKIKENNTNLYNLDIAPDGNRKISYLPPEPEFALTNDTSVTLKFNIDKQGNTYNITFISRSSTEIEKLSYDYISNMKFDAIIDDREDFAQITIFFKVQKPKI